MTDKETKMIEKIKEELELLNEPENTNYEDFIKKCGYLLALRNYEIISFDVFVKLLRDI